MYGMWIGTQQHNTTKVTVWFDFPDICLASLSCCRIGHNSLIVNASLERDRVRLWSIHTLPDISSSTGNPRDPIERKAQSAKQQVGMYVSRTINRRSTTNIHPLNTIIKQYRGRHHRCAPFFEGVYLGNHPAADPPDRGLSHSKLVCLGKPSIFSWTAR